MNCRGVVAVSACPVLEGGIIYIEIEVGFYYVPSGG